MSYTGQTPGYTTPAPGTATGPRAGFWIRFGAVFIDGILLGIINAIIQRVLLKNSLAAGEAVSILLNLAYFTYFEGGPRGQTLGKRATGIRVVDFNTGGSIGYGRAAIRYVGSIVSAIPILLGYFWMLWDRENQTWHDKFANSLVVPEASYPIPVA